jgi:hypothetical protein
LILLENHDWAEITGSPECPYLNQTLQPRSSIADHYFTPTNNHPSLPNYLWLVGCTNYGITNDGSPAVNTRNTTNHLAWLLDRAGVSWRCYAESLPTNRPPISTVGNYVPRHVPFLYFKNINTNLAYVAQHIRPFPEFANDLAQNTIARFNFITPNLTNDMHNAAGAVGRRKLGDNWLARNVPLILDSDAWKQGGLILIVWDEGTRATADGDESDGPMGLVALAPTAKGHGYLNHQHYDHSATLRTLEDIFDVQPYLGAAATSPDLSDLFVDSPKLSWFPNPASPTHFRVNFTAPGHVYTLESLSQMGEEPWSEAGKVTASGPTVDFPLPAALAGERVRFFRATIRP